VPLSMSNGKLPFPSGEGALCIIRGTSPRGDHGHVVVGAISADGRSIDLIHDPFPNGPEPMLSTSVDPIWAAFYVPLPE
ncbi:hypothetical protein SARC_17961, partial [Sphaeroforma arctica JP610]